MGDVAREAGVSVVAISNVERGLPNADLVTACAYIRGMRTSQEFARAYAELADAAFAVPEPTLLDLDALALDDG